jgi:hypothetical protein
VEVDVDSQATDIKTIIKFDESGISETWILLINLAIKVSPTDSGWSIDGVNQLLLSPAW